MRHFIGQAIYGLLAGFDTATLCWIGWGLATPGDFFGNGSPLVEPSLIASALAGFALGYTRKDRVIHIAVIVLAAIAVLFDFFGPHGWWTHGPPL